MFCLLFLFFTGAQFTGDCYKCVTAKGCYYCPGDGTCQNSDLYTSKRAMLSCTEAKDYLSLSGGDTREACVSPNAFTKDPSYEGSKWMFDMVRVEDVWTKYGLTGKGITVRINDDGVYVDNLEFEGRFDAPENSCSTYLPAKLENEVDGHGTRVAGIILANADNDLCGVGIAHEAMFSACNFFADNVPYSALAYKLETFDISQNSIGMP